MTTIALMLFLIAVAAAADGLGLSVLHRPIIVLFSVAVGAHVMLLLWLSRPANEGR